MYPYIKTIIPVEQSWNIMDNILIYLKLLSRKFDSGNILCMDYCDYMALYNWGVDKLLYAKYGKEKLWLYMDNGYIEKFVWDEFCGCYLPNRWYR